MLLSLLRSLLKLFPHAAVDKFRRPTGDIMRAAMRSAIGQEIIERIVRKNWSIGSCLARSRGVRVSPLTYRALDV